MENYSACLTEVQDISVMDDDISYSESMAITNQLIIEHGLPAHLDIMIHEIPVQYIRLCQPWTAMEVADSINHSYELKERVTPELGNHDGGCREGRSRQKKPPSPSATETYRSRPSSWSKEISQQLACKFSYKALPTITLTPVNRLPLKRLVVAAGVAIAHSQLNQLHPWHSQSVNRIGSRPEDSAQQHGHPVIDQVPVPAVAVHVRPAATRSSSDLCCRLASPARAKSPSSASSCSPMCRRRPHWNLQRRPNQVAGIRSQAHRAAAKDRGGVGQS